jgi:chromosome segregation ATPase
MTESEDAIQKLRSEHEQLRLSVHTMEQEREQSMAKQSATQELVGMDGDGNTSTGSELADVWDEQISKIKSECVMLRTKLKEVEMDYRTLQAKHRYIRKV